MSAFGELVSSSTLEEAVISRLTDWMPTVTAEAERQAGERVGSLPALRSIRALSGVERWPEAQLPALVVLSTGTTNQPVRDGDGYYSATYSIAATVVVSANEQLRARKIAQLYSAAVRACLVQRRSLGQHIQAGDWLGEDYDRLTGVEDSRSILAVTNLFEMDVRNIVSWKLGPPPSWVAPETPVDAEVPADPTDEIPGSHTATDIAVEIETN